MFFFSALGSRSGGVLICFFHLIWGLCILDTGCVCVDGPSVGGSGSMSLVLCFFSSVGNSCPVLGYFFAFLFSLGMLVPGVLVSPLSSVVNRRTDGVASIDVLCCTECFYFCFLFPSETEGTAMHFRPAVLTTATAAAVSSAAERTMQMAPWLFFLHSDEVRTGYISKLLYPLGRPCLSSVLFCMYPPIIFFDVLNAFSVYLLMWS